MEDARVPLVRRQSGRMVQGRASECGARACRAGGGVLMAADRERVVQAVERAMREVLRDSTAGTDGEWRADAERVADAALKAIAEGDR